MPTIKELTDQRVKLIDDARAIMKKAEGEKRAMTPEETTNFDKAIDDGTGLKDRIDGLEREERRRKSLEDAETWAKESRGRISQPGQPGENPEEPEKDVEVRFGPPSREQRIVCKGRRESRGYRKTFVSYLVEGNMGLQAAAAESRSLQADSDVIGGFLVAPQQFAANIIKRKFDLVFMRQMATVLPPLTQAESLGIPSLDVEPDDADWTSELKTGNEDSAMKLGKRELRPHPMAKRVKISKKLLRISSLDPEALVRERLAYKAAITEEKAYLTGSGAQQPLGVFVASVNGISTGRDVSTGNTATAITFDGLINAKFSIKGQYWDNLAWIFHRDAVSMISKLKDGEGRYIWQPSTQVGNPDMLLGKTFKMSEYAPNTFTTGLYAGIIGDFSYYWIVDALTMSIQVLLELYAEANQNGYILRQESDGAPVLEDAFARVKLG